jgi:hypothetical protein
MHILQQIPSIRKFVKYEKYLPLIENKITKENTIMNFIVYEFTRAIKLSLENDNIKIAPYSFKNLMGKKNSMWAEIEHQDSQEFYSYLISKIEEECGQNIKYIPQILEKSKSTDQINNTNILQLLAINYIHKSEIKDYSPIKNMFVGYLISNTQCCYCLTNSPCFEAFNILQLRSNTTKSCPNKWGLFGGKIEDNETPLQAIIREINEELELELKIHEIELMFKTIYLNDEINISATAISYLANQSYINQQFTNLAHSQPFYIKPFIDQTKL